MRIALADDDPELLESLSQAIIDAGHELQRFRTGTDLKTSLQRETYDVVLLDWNMPGHTGLAIVEWAVSKLEHPPAFILITSRTNKSDVITGLKAGATDYVVKPELSEVVLARIEAAHRRRTPPQADRAVRHGEYVFDRLLQQVRLGKKDIALTNKEFGLALLFFENLNQPLSRGYVFSEIWDGALDVESRTLDLHVSRIRSKLELRPQNGFAIQTVFGFGYRMDEIGQIYDHD